MDRILDTAPCGFLSLADDGRILQANRTLLALLDYAQDALVGTHIDRLLPVGSRIFYQTHLFPLLKLRGHAQEIYLTVRTRSGVEIPTLVNAVRHERDGVPVNDWVLISMRRRNEYEEQILRARKIAEEATRAKDEFLAVVSHELRTPLTAVLGWVRLLRTGKLDAGSQARAIEAIERNAQAQTQLVDDILDFARIIAGKLRLDAEPLDVTTVVEAAVDVLRPAAEAKAIRIATTLDPRAGPVFGDAGRLQQVLWNLLANAVKFTPKGGRVQVHLSRVNSSVEIAVVDSGCGIDRAFLPFVFERFRQADGSSTRERAGLGLGLSISRHIVELHGGTIRADSPGDGLGATFTVRLPVMAVHDRREDGQAPATESGDPGGDRGRAGRLDGCHVLVVEDDDDARELIARIIRESGGTVTTATGARDALEALHRARPRLLLSDIEMPGEDGYALLRRVRALSPESGGRTPAIALTARAKPDDRLKALSAGFQLHIAKPVDPEELVVAIANLVGQRAA